MLDEFQVMQKVRDGTPIEFEIVEFTADAEGNETSTAHKFALRQMTPAERDKLRYIETLTEDKTLADYRAQGLGGVPISDGLKAQVDTLMASLELDYQKALKAGDQAVAIDAARKMEKIPGNLPIDLAQERANEEVKRAFSRWAIDHLLNGDRAVFNRLTAPEPLYHNAVIVALADWQKLAIFDPNLNGRKQSSLTS